MLARYIDYNTFLGWNLQLLFYMIGTRTADVAKTKGFKISPNALCKCLNGKSNILARHIYEVCKALKIEQATFFTFVNEVEKVLKENDILIGDGPEDSLIDDLPFLFVKYRLQIMTAFVNVFNKNNVLRVDPPLEQTNLPNLF